MKRLHVPHVHIRERGWHDMFEDMIEHTINQPRTDEQGMEDETVVRDDEGNLYAIVPNGGDDFDYELIEPSCDR